MRLFYWGYVMQKIKHTQADVMAALFDLINLKAYDNELDKPDIFHAFNFFENVGLSVVYFENEHGLDGIFLETNKGETFLGVDCSLPEPDFLLTFIHECVHVAQNTYNEKLRHGKKFDAECLRVLSCLNH